MTPDTKKVACIQMRSGLSRMQNIEDAQALIKQAAEAGAMLIATPEMTNVVDRNPARLLNDLPIEEALPEIETFSNIAKEHGIWLLIGSMALKARKNDPTDHQRAHNRSFLFTPDGAVAARYDKIHMFDVALPKGETWRESAVYKPGDKAVVAPTPMGMLGLSICYDIRFPHLYRQLAQKGAEILCVPAAFTRQTGRAHWEILLRARAIECGAFVIAPAQGGDHEDGRETWGHSMIINPWGEIIAHKPDDDPGFIIADLEIDTVKLARQRIPSLDLEQSYTLLT